MQTLDIQEKIAVLDSFPEVRPFFSLPPTVHSFFATHPPKYVYIIKAIFAIKQGHLFPKEFPSLQLLQSFLEELLMIDSFYANIGGIIGYQHLALTLLHEKKASIRKVALSPPQSIELHESTTDIDSAILTAIRDQETMAECYPIGGSADRLQFRDDKTGENLPAAHFIFLGKPLLVRAIEDLQAREYLHYKVFHKQIITPIVMMTSNVYNNSAHIQEICKKNHWFNRPRTRFCFVTQPSVPVFTRDGDWCLQIPLKLLLKPGGHGMLWTLFEKKGIFEWVTEEMGCKKMLIRQVNNPIAGTDYGLLAFLGIGHEKNSSFGVASCPRLVQAQEGMLVIKERCDKGKIFRALTNIEYCDFFKYHIKDQPCKEGSPYSHFPSNTNILFVDLKRAQEVVKKDPLPGLLINFRKDLHHHSGGRHEEVARLESSMQNIAEKIDVEESYLTCNKRCKTISTIKHKRKTNGTTLETPEGCYYEYMLNIRELLENHCHFSLPTLPEVTTFLKKGPPFLFSFHPALGPLYSIIGRKVQRGVLHEGSELQLEIANLFIDHLELDGSLLIYAQRVMGHIDKQGVLQYSDYTGQCFLKNVYVKNRGVNWKETPPPFLQHNTKRFASFKIILHGHSQFVAQDISLRGNFTVEVPHGMCMTAQQGEEGPLFITEPINCAKPFWNYKITEHKKITIL